MPLHWQLPSLSGLRSWLAGPSPAPHVPRQETGTAAGRPHQVPASATRAVAHAAGRAAGKGPGQLPMYAVHKPPADRGLSATYVGDGSQSFSPATSKLVPGSSTATSSLYRNTDGTMSRLVYLSPVNYQDSAGAWHPIDTTLAQGSGGRWAERANAISASFAAAADNAQLASLGLGSGEQVSLGLAGAAAVPGVGGGSSVSYAGVLPGTDVSAAATPTGLRLSLRLDGPGAGGSWVLPLAGTGLSPQLAGGGTAVQFLTSSGIVAARLGPAYLADSSRTAGGLPAVSSAVTYQLVPYPGGTAVKVTADAGWLAAAARVFPVTASLELATPTPQAGQAATQAVAGQVPVVPGGQMLAAGSFSRGQSAAATVLQFPAFPASFPGLKITSVSLHVFGSTVPGCSVPNLAVDVLRHPAAAGQGAPAAAAGSGTWRSAGSLTPFTCGNPSLASGSAAPRPSTPAAKPSPASAAPAPAGTAGRSPSASPAPAAPSPTADPVPSPTASTTTGSAVPPVTATPAPTPTATVPAAVANAGAWQTAALPLSSLGTPAGSPVTLAVTSPASGGSQGQLLSPAGSTAAPYLVIAATQTAPDLDLTYPPDNYNATSLRQELRASAHDSDGDTLHYVFNVFDSSGNQIATSNAITDNDWTIPAKKLAWNKTYEWTVQVTDGTTTVPSSPSVNFLSTPVPQPTMTSTLSQNTGGHGFSPSTRNYTTTVTDAKVATVGPALEIDRSYNSLDPRTAGAFGEGWSSVLDMKVRPGLTDADGEAETQIVTYPDGQEVAFGLNSDGTSYTAPPGRYAVLAPVTGGFTLTDKNDTKYTFTQSLGGSVYGISSITDAFGHALNFTYNTATPPQVTQVKSGVSGRALNLTWNGTGTGSHVASVVTDPVTAGNQSSALTWGYSYSGDQLTRVCPPISTTVCTNYSYTAGTTFPATVQDTGVHGYWTLGDVPGSANAANSVLTDADTDPGVYSNVTLGQPGPLPGSTGTAAGFNGTSSYITMPNNLMTQGTYESVGVWFKTTASGVLFSYQNQSVANGTASDFTPALYVGTDGYLRGEFWNGSASPMKSAVKVNDGNWHYALLTTVGGTSVTQKLYLDNNAPLSMSGPTTMPGDQDYDYAGTGYIGNSWPAEPNQGNSSKLMYFTGSMAHLGIWDQSLTPDQVTAMW
ncbi:MAG: DUF6531 domain-containing protein [Micromonosporaceae bacterium]